MTVEFEIDIFVVLCAVFLAIAVLSWATMPRSAGYWGMGRMMNELGVFTENESPLL